MWQTRVWSRVFLRLLWMITVDLHRVPPHLDRMRMSGIHHCDPALLLHCTVRVRTPTVRKSVTHTSRLGNAPALDFQLILSGLITSRYRGW